MLLNQGDGIFAAAAAYAAGHSPSSVAIGDLDGDNGPDLTVANRSGNDVSVLLNQGDGTFAAAVAYAAGREANSVAIGDLDGVNGPDLAV
ncbi:MAG: FG-GAP-like repeat-containing protein, partial [Planctomycetota bacterium]